VPIQGDPVEDIVTAILAVDDVSFTMEAQFRKRLTSLSPPARAVTTAGFWFMRMT
jgi:hypothetical protein